MMQTLERLCPWSRKESTRWLLIAAGGHVLWAIALVLTRTADGEKPGFDSQINPMNLAVLAFIIAAYADASMLLRGHRLIVQRETDLVGRLAVFEPRSRTPIAATTVGRVQAGPGLDLFHRTECPVTFGKSWSAVERSEAIVAGQRPCAMCEP